MSYHLFHTTELANVADYLTRVDFSRPVLRAIAEDLAIWSQAHARAFNEQHAKRVGPASAPGILDAYDSEDFRYDRARALEFLRLMSVNVQTGAGGPAEFESFDSARYFKAFSEIMDLAFRRLLAETGAD